MDFSSHMAMKKVHINTQKDSRQRLLVDVLIKTPKNEYLFVVV